MDRDAEFARLLVKYNAYNSGQLALTVKNIPTEELEDAFRSMRNDVDQYGGLFRANIMNFTTGN